MGVIRWLNRVDPATWASACGRLVTAPPATPAEAQAFLTDFNREASDYLMGSFDDLLDEPDLLSTLLNSLLEEATKEESWTLDKSLSHGLERVPALIPALAPLRKIIDFRGIDHEPPKTCSPDEGSGLFGCISSAQLTDCVAVVHELPTSHDLALRLRDVRPGALARLFGREKRAEELAAQLENKYFAAHWSNLRSALLETSKRGHLLGLGMSI